MIDKQMSIEEYTDRLAGKDPVPGGGASCAISGAIGAALSGMVCSLTIGKKKYAGYEELLRFLQEKNRKCQNTLLELICADTEAFAPIAAVYRMPKDTEEEKKQREDALQYALKDACEVPFQIMKISLEAVKLLKALIPAGAVLAVSDAGAAACFLRTALEGSYLNLAVNTKSMKDRDAAEKLLSEAETMREEGVRLSEEAYREVLERIGVWKN